MPSIKWLHLSDFHVGKDNYGQRKLFSQIHQNVAARIAKGFIPDFVFLSGDIANKGKCEPSPLANLGGNKHLRPAFVTAD